MTDKIHIRDLKLRTRVGIRDWEKEKLQDVVIDVTLEADLAEGARTDDIDDTVDYKVVKDRIVDLVEGSQYDLLEALASDIAELCLKPDRVESVTVTVDKPGALRFSDSVAVEITRP
jgi:dihydroneopterin aldolase/D-erythro-7,8-dihydroneopterin triphosphate epimerase